MITLSTPYSASIPSSLGIRRAICPLLLIKVLIILVVLQLISAQNGDIVDQPLLHDAAPSDNQERQDHNRQLVSTRQNEDPNVLQLGESCGGIFPSKTCRDGLTCVGQGAFWAGGGQCYPLDCIQQAVETFHEEVFDMMEYKDTIFDLAGTTPHELWQSRTESDGDQAFATSSPLLQTFTRAMREYPFPWDAMTQLMDPCFDTGSGEGGGGMQRVDNNNGNAKAATKQARTNYVGFHLEGGIIFDGSFSVFNYPGTNNTQQTVYRGCFSSGGAGIDVSALIGMGMTGTGKDLEGCSVLIQDWELGLGPAFGIEYGLMLEPRVQYLDFTIGAGVTFEGSGFGMCGNWPAG